MNDPYLPISIGQVALSALLLLSHVGLSYQLRLGLGRTLIVASVRMVVQLFLVAFVLEWIFTQRHPAIILAMALWMAGIAGITSVQRQAHRFPGIYWRAWSPSSAAPSSSPGSASPTSFGLRRSTIHNT